MILDTNAVSALADGDAGLVEAAASVERFSLPVVVLGEFQFGIARSRHRARYARWLEQLVTVVLPVDSNRNPSNS